MAQIGPINNKRLKLHETLSKAESALATQLRTEKIGLANFLFKQRVPTVTTPACPCGWPRQTPQHVIMNCGLQRNRAHLLGEADTDSYPVLLGDPRRLKLVTAWMMKTGLLSQFSLTVQDLYS